MKVKSYGIVISIICCLLLAAKSSLAVEMVDIENTPNEYVKVTNVDGKKEFIFGSVSTTYSPDEYNQILKCYGAELTDKAKAPRGYVTLKEKNGESVYIFDSVATAYDAEEFNNMLQAYGLELTMPEVAPNNFVTIAKDKDGKEVLRFNRDWSSAHSPEVLNKILMAYN